ncbi:MAG: hypothetical protein O2954_01980 [bacterium]|nr:hypothetical protein [bacterium]
MAEIREIGVPVRSVSWTRLHAGRNGKGEGRILATMGQQSENMFLLDIDPETGEFLQFNAEVPRSGDPTATLMARSGTLYVGAAYSGHLYGYDPAEQVFQDLGAIAPEAATFPCRMDEDAQGRIWIGSYGTADLTCFDPVTGTFTRYGRMDEVDMYNYPLVNTDGTVACLIRMTQPHVVVLDPESGTKTMVGPTVPKGEGSIDLRRGTDGKLYIVSSAGDFRVDGTTAVPVDAVPDPESAAVLSDGSTFRFADAAEQINRKLEVKKPDGSAKVFDLEYRAGGTSLFYIHTGPDDLIYGSSILPLHLFRYNPGTEELVDLGKCSSVGGEAYSMGNLDGQMYISSYTGATLSVYDPSKPYHFGNGPEDNPRDLGRIDDISYRPRSTLAGPAGKVWVASVPDYGRWGGPLSYYDPATGEKKAFYRIVGDGSCYTLAHLEAEGLIAVGTTISAGSGTQPKVDQAVLFLFDYEKEEKVWEGTLDRTVHSFNALVTGPDGRLYGTARGGDVAAEIFVFDPKTRVFTDRIPAPEGGPLDLGLQNGPEGKIYGMTGSCLYRLDPASLEVEEVIREEGAFKVVGPIQGKDMYFAQGHRLMAARVF